MQPHLAKKIDAEVCATVFGHEVDEWVGEYIAHGASKVYVCDNPKLKYYSTDTYVALMERIVSQYGPEIILVGATSFGREFTPRLAKRLKTGLTADCVGLDINDEACWCRLRRPLEGAFSPESSPRRKGLRWRPSGRGCSRRYPTTTRPKARS